MRSLKILFLCAFWVMGCSEDTGPGFSNRIDADTFTLHAPEGWALFEDQGYDTYIGRIARGRDIIYFDQGYWSFGGLDKIAKNESTIYLQQITIDSVPAIIHKTKFDDDHQILLSVYIETVDLNRNHLYILNPSSSFHEKTLVDIILTHKFK